MKKIKILLIATMLIFSTVNAETASEQLAQLLTNFHAMSANFTQTPTSNNNLGTAAPSSGHMVILRPGKFLWQVEKPSKQLLVTNGKIVWIYDVDLQQVTQQKLDQSSATSPGALLSGSVKDLQQRFNVTLLPNSDVGVYFKLIPQGKNDMFAWVKLHFVKNVLVEMELKDNLGQTNQFKFTDVIINPPLNTQMFEFKTPAGVDVINN